MLSHTKTWQEKDEPKRETKPAPAKAPKADKPASAQQPERGATLGDLEALSALKEQMESRNNG